MQGCSCEHEIKHLRYVRTTVPFHLSSIFCLTWYTAVCLTLILFCLFPANNRKQSKTIENKRKRCRDRSRFSCTKWRPSVCARERLIAMWRQCLSSTSSSRTREAVCRFGYIRLAIVAARGYVRFGGRQGTGQRAEYVFFLPSKDLRLFFWLVSFFSIHMPFR